MKKLTWLALGLYIMSFSSVGFACYKKEHKIVKVIRNPLQEKLHRFTKDKYIAEVLATTKYPKTLAAIAMVESDCRPQARGDNGQAFGMYQIWPKWHGAVPDSVEGQTRKAEQLLTSLIESYGYNKGIERWNGSGRNARIYRQKVMIAMRSI